MRTKFSGAIFAVALLLALSDAGGAQEKRQREKGNGWSAFGKGSWVVVQRVVKIGDEEKKQRKKSVIVGFEEDEVHVAKMPEKDGEFVDAMTTALMGHRFTPRGNAFEEGKARDEIIEIAGKKVECSVQEFVRTSKKPAFTARFLFWRAKNVTVPYREIPNDANIAVPPDAVKTQYIFEGEGMLAKKCNRSRAEQAGNA